MCADSSLLGKIGDDVFDDCGGQEQEMTPDPPDPYRHHIDRVKPIVHPISDVMELLARTSTLGRLPQSAANCLSFPTLLVLSCGP